MITEYVLIVDGLAVAYSRYDSYGKSWIHQKVRTTQEDINKALINNLTAWAESRNIKNYQIKNAKQVEKLTFAKEVWRV